MLKITIEGAARSGKSTYRGCPCYYLDHSGIEYIWVDREQWEPEQMEQR